MSKLAMLALCLTAAGVLVGCAQAGPGGGLTAGAFDEEPINSWVLRNPDGPNIIWENGIAWDPATQLLAWYGGHAWGYPQSNYTHLYDVKTNTWRDSQAPYRPQRRCLVMVNYIDSAGKVVCTQGGSGHGSMPEGGFDADYRRVVKSDPRGPWLLDVAADRWENCRTLPPIWRREAHAQCAYDAGSDALVWLTGERLGIYVPRTNRVHYRDLPQKLHRRLAYAIAADPVNRKIVVFGGSGPGGWMWYRDLTREQAYERHVHNDTWIYDIATDAWKQAQPDTSPPKGVPMDDHRYMPMVYHDPSGTLLMQQTPLDRYEPDRTKWPATQLWSFDVATEQWKLVPMENSPAFCGLLAYARDIDLLFLVGGGKDGEIKGGDGKVNYRPSLSKQLWTCRVQLDASHKPRPAAPALDIEHAGDKVTLRLESAAASSGFWRAEVDPATGIPGPYRYIFGSSGRPGPTVVLTAVDAVEKGKTYAYLATPGSTRNQEQATDLHLSPVRTLPAFTQPWQPGGLVASVESPRRVVLRWNGNTETDLAGYNVYRATGREVEKAEGTLLTKSPISFDSKTAPVPQFADDKVDLSDGVARIYWVTAVNQGGIESGASPLAYTFPDPPPALNVVKGDDGRTLTVTWDWPEGVKIAGVNVYHVNNHLNTHGEPAEKVRAWFDSWNKVNETPAADGKLVFTVPAGEEGRHHYFYLRAVNLLGQEGFHTDIASATDRRFRP